MQAMMCISIFWTLYGIAGIFGFQNIPTKYKGYSWTKDYIRCQGKSWLMIGLPWLAIYLMRTFCFADIHISMGLMVLIFFVISIPAIAYTVIWEKKFKDLLAKEIDNK